jgi:hypothetical protein
MFTLRRYATVQNFCRLALITVLVLAVQHLRHEKSPWNTAWARHLAEGKNPSFSEHLKTGLWWGAAARAAVAAILLILSAFWSRTASVHAGSEFQLGRAGDYAVSRRTFWIALGLIVFGAALMRLPRMEQSFWGDEADAVATYIHGQYLPVDKEDLQGALTFDHTDWKHTFFSAKHGPNNHVLFSLTSRACLNVWQWLTGKSEAEFTEWPLRVPSLLCGLGSLVSLALLLRRWGVPFLGLLAALVLALHPWHVRYSTEARGYAITLCLFPVLLLVMTRAFEQRGWKNWLLFGLTEFLLMYSWPGIAYPLAFVNFTVLAFMLARSDRWPQVLMWTTANLLAGAAFFSLYAPHLPQITQYNKTHLWMKGMPMDAVWLHNLLAAPFTGIIYHGKDSSNPALISWERLLSVSPLITAAGFSVIIGLTVLGLATLWRRNFRAAALVTSVFLSAAVAALHFKFVIGDELRVWYLIFTLPFIATCVAAGLVTASAVLPRQLRVGGIVLLLAVMSVSVWPMNNSLMIRASEDFKSATDASRGLHEAGIRKERSSVFTCWLWRSSYLYDPRAEIHVRNAQQLREQMNAARAASGALYVIVGFRELAEDLSGDLLRLLDDPSLFAKTTTFHTSESSHTLEVYEMKK